MTDAIRQLLRCATCHRRLDPNGPSLYWCDRQCQASWQERHATPQPAPGTQVALLPPTPEPKPSQPEGPCAVGFGVDGIEVDPSADGFPRVTVGHGNGVILLQLVGSDGRLADGFRGTALNPGGARRLSRLLWQQAGYAAGYIVGGDR